MLKRSRALPATACGTLLLLAMTGAIAGAKVEPKAVKLVPVGRAPGSGVAQIVAAGGKGGAFVLTEELKVYAVSPGKPAELELTLATDSLPFRPLRAALSEAGDLWALITASGGVEVFEKGKGSLLAPPPAPPRAVIFSGSVPVVTLDPFRGPVEALPTEFREGSAPIALKYEGSEWEPLVRASAESMPGEMTPLKRLLETSVRLFSDKKGSFWVARDYSYELSRYSAGARRILTISDPTRRLSADSEVENPEFQAAIERRGLDPSRKATVVSIPGTPVIRAVAARNGDAFILTGDGKFEAQLNLDRVEGASGDTFRTSLALRSAECVTSMAAARDGLFLACHRAEDGIFFASWEDLDAATWTLVASSKGDKAAPEDSQAAP